MKRIVLLVLAFLMTLSVLTGCTFHMCDLCGDRGICDKKTLLGQEFYICRDCQKTIDDLF